MIRRRKIGDIILKPEVVRLIKELSEIKRGHPPELSEDTHRDKRADKHPLSGDTHRIARTVLNE